MAGKQEKEVTALVKLQLPAGGANPAPPVGPALGQHGVQSADFCKAFNDRTENLERGLKVPVIITIYADRSFDFIVKTPPASLLLRRAAGIDKGSPTPNSEKVGTVSRAQLEAIATEKMVDLNANDMDAAVRIIAGSARSMGLVVEE